MSTDRTATHSGTCQACGRQHAVNVKTGKLAKHGYTVDWGFFNGTCQGSGHLPLQQDIKLNLEIINALYNLAANLEEEADGEILKVSAQVGYSDYDNRGSRKPVYQLVDRERFDSPEVRRYTYGSFDRAVELTRHRLRHQATQFRAHAAELAALREQVHGTDLIAREVEAPIKREYFNSYREAYARVEALKAAGHKAQQRRERWSRNYTVTYR
tara:strand:- start:2688 stop:3326 length:639 start_codon:yes stop_codon:yes gene_type:complete